eukprot:758412-Hanusia_phi.AAC.4
MEGGVSNPALSPAAAAVRLRELNAGRISSLGSLGRARRQRQGRRIKLDELPSEDPCFLVENIICLLPWRAQRQQPGAGSEGFGPGVGLERNHGVGPVHDVVETIGALQAPPVTAGCAHDGTTVRTIADRQGHRSSKRI